MSTNSKKLVKFLNGIASDVSINKSDKIYANNALKNIEQFASKSEFKKVKSIIDLLDKGRVTDDDKKAIIKAKGDVIPIIQKYEEHFNADVNEDKIDKNLTFLEVEQMLDSKINKYNGFNMKHPMDGVIYDKTNEKYLVTIGGKKKSFRESKDAVEHIKEAKKENLFEKIDDNLLKIHFYYKGHYFIAYSHNNQLLFDIQHIISVLNLQKTSSNDKYNEFSDKITNCLWHPNEFGGFILRELINEEAMYGIILSSQSTFSKSFKKDVCKILVNLRQTNKIDIINDQLVLNDNFMAYNNIKDIASLKVLVKKGSKYNLLEYVNQHVLYVFVITIQRNHTYVIIKFGYTYNIIQRWHDLLREYKSDLFLLDLKHIKAEKIENNFHRFIKDKYPENIEEVKIGNINKTEMYKLNMNLINEFHDVKTFNQAIDDEYVTPKKHLHICDFFQKQYDSFCKFTSDKLKTNPPIGIDHTAYLDFIHKETIEEHKYNLEMKDREIISMDKQRTHELKMMDIEIISMDKQRTHELKMMDIEIISMDKQRAHELAMIKEKKDFTKEKRKNLKIQLKITNGNTLQLHNKKTKNQRDNDSDSDDPDSDSDDE